MSTASSRKKEKRHFDASVLGGRAFHFSFELRLRWYDGALMLTISELGKSYGPKTLFEGVSLQVSREDRIGLLGERRGQVHALFARSPNRIPDAGSITLEKNATVGHLPRKPRRRRGNRLGIGHRHHAGNRGFAEEIKAAESEHSAAHHEIDYHDNIHARYDALAAINSNPGQTNPLRLEFPRKGLSPPLREMSGGWVMRAISPACWSRRPTC